MKFWQDKKVFLTGHTGFKGSWLSIWLQQLGAEVTGYSLEPPTKPSLFELAKVAEGMNNIHGDIRDLESLKKALTKSQAEIVIHMAAQSLVRDSYKFPVETYSTNIMGTVNVLEAGRLQQSVRAVLNITSDKCYENREWTRGYRENEPMGGYDPYSSSKGCAELVTSAYRNSYFNANKAVASARAGNVIGGGDWAEDRLIPDVMRALITNKSVTIRSPNAVRPWQHVVDPLDGYIPDGMRFEQALELRAADPDRYQAEAFRTMKRHCSQMIELQARGADTFDYGNNLRGHAKEAGLENAFDFEGFVPKYVRPLFCEGLAPFAGPRSRATRPTSPSPTASCSSCSPRRKRCPAGSAWRASAFASRDCRHASAGWATASARRPAWPSTRRSARERSRRRS